MKKSYNQKINSVNNWISSRNKDNFFYTTGSEIVYSDDCQNSLTISDEKNGYIRAEKNYAIIRCRGITKKIPISNMKKIIQESKKIISKENVHYQKPKLIFQGGNLPEIKESEIKEKLQMNYGIYINKILKIKNKKGKNRIYKITSENNQKFILKYRNKNSNLFIAQTELLKNVDMLPKIIINKHGSPLIHFNKNNFALEEFAKGGNFLWNEKKYFTMLGENIAKMHNQINSSIKNNPTLEKILIEEGNLQSESNLISMHLDLMNENNYNNDLQKESLKLIQNNLSGKLNSLPNQIIHFDLNKSNLLWKKEKVKIIDPETLRVSKRVNEFIRPLTLKGNSQSPIYTQGSLGRLISSYNRHIENKLTPEEIKIIPELIKFYLLKLYTIYYIRKNDKKRFTDDQLKISMKKLGEEKL